MRRTLMLLTVASVAASAVAQGTEKLSPAEHLLALAAKNTDGAMALVRFTFKNELVTREMAGQGTCIRPSGLFMTLALNAGMEPENIQDLKLIMPGPSGKEYDAKFVGIDRRTGIGFVQAEGKTTWKAVVFAKKADLFIGQRVASVGLMPGDTGNARSLGLAYVSTMILAPERMVYVTGGNLTPVGSPVFDASGKAIGIVQKQRFQLHTFVINRQPVAAGVRGQEETSFFMPVDEFADAVAEPMKERPLSWVGVVEFKTVGKEKASILEDGQAAIMLQKVVPGGPAADAGLKESDVIVGVNDKPVEVLGTPALTAEYFYRAVLHADVGTTFKFDVLRDDKAVPIVIKTKEMPPWPRDAKRYYSSELGLGVRERVMLDDYLADSPSSKAPGLVVYHVQRDSPAHWAQAMRNDVVVSVSGTPVRTVDTVRQMVEDALKNKLIKKLDMDVMRGDRQQTLKVPLPGR